MSGPSGVGKSSVVEGLRERHPFRFSVSATTRDPRPGEVDGEDYHFVDRARFEEMIEAGELLEWAEYNGRLYGTPAAPVVETLSAGHDVVLDIENKGAAQVRSSHPDAILVFIAPPSLDELRRRLVARGDTVDVEGRLAVAEQQIDAARGLYDHFVVNDELDTAIGRVADILARPASSEPVPTNPQETSQ